MAGPGGGEAEGQCTWGLDDSDVMMKVFQFLSLGDLLRASQVTCSNLAPVNSFQCLHSPVPPLYDVPCLRRILASCQAVFCS